MVTRSLEETLGTLEVNGSEKNYVYVDSKSKGFGPSVPIASTEEWQEQVLKDPKV